MHYLIGPLLALLTVLPAAAQNTTYATAQRFENGVMIYRADTGTIYALAGAPHDANGQAWTFPSASYSRLPKNDIIPPGGLLAPEQGFGRVWSDNDVVRGALGWATLPELGFEMGVSRTPEGVLHLRQLDGTVYAISPSGRWTKAEPRTPDDSDNVEITRFEVTPTEASPGDTITVSWEIDGNPPYRAILLNHSVPRYGRITSRDLAATRGTAAFTIPVDVQGHIEVRLETGTFDHPGASGPRLTPYFLDSAEQIVHIEVVDGGARTEGAYIQFQHGFMIWRGDTGRVLAFLETDDLPNAFNGTFSYFDEYLFEDFTMLQQVPPRLGFDWAWGIDEDRQRRFGAPIAEVESYTLTINRQPDSTSYSLPSGDIVVVDSGGAYWLYGD